MLKSTLLLRMCCFVSCVGFLLGIFIEAFACNVPVFRYALERWPADPYQVFVYYREPLQSIALARLQKSAFESDSLANFTLKLYNVSDAQVLAMAESRAIRDFPWIEVFYPANAQVRGLVWEGPGDEHLIAKILESPARAQLRQKLLSGAVAVWILVQCGDKSRDNAAWEILTKSLDRASRELKIPEMGVDTNGNPLVVGDFRDYPVHFNHIRMVRNDPEEVMLINSLLGSESDLETMLVPLAFPVFGRGRSLYALVGDGITEKNILNTCQNLINWCSCEIKASNPGIDLLMTADWSRPFGGVMVKDDPLPPLSGLANFLPQESTDTVAQERTVPLEVDSSHLDEQPVIETSDLSASAEKPATPPPSAQLAPRMARNVVVVVGLCLSLVLILTVLIRNRKSIN